LSTLLPVDFFFFYLFARILAMKDINAEERFASSHAILSHAFYAVCSVTGTVTAKSDHFSSSSYKSFIFVSGNGAACY
jgi:hypothetical protein